MSLTVQLANSHSLSLNNEFMVFDITNHDDTHHYYGFRLNILPKLDNVFSALCSELDNTYDAKAENFDLEKCLADLRNVFSSKIYNGPINPDYTIDTTKFDVTNEDNVFSTKMVENATILGVPMYLEFYDYTLFVKPIVSKDDDTQWTEQYNAQMLVRTTDPSFIFDSGKYPDYIISIMFANQANFWEHENLWMTHFANLIASQLNDKDEKFMRDFIGVNEDDYPITSNKEDTDMKDVDNVEVDEDNEDNEDNEDESEEDENLEEVD